MKLTEDMIQMRERGETYQYIANTTNRGETSVRMAFKKRRNAISCDNAKPTAIKTAIKTVVTTAAKTIGVSLKNANVFQHRPQDRAKGLIYGLKKGRGFPIGELSEEWGMSEDTIKKHAKRFGAYLFVEVDPGNYVACIVHPDTAEKNGES